jgi:hypothetical protein
MNMIRGGNGSVRQGVKRPGSRMEAWMTVPLIFPPQTGNYQIGSLTITAEIGPYNMRRILIDTRASSDILYEQCFRCMTIEDQRRLVRVDAPITRFSGETVYPQGEITFPVTSGARRTGKNGIGRFFGGPDTIRI